MIFIFKQLARPEYTWFTYQDNVENRDRASEATFVRFLRQDNVLQNLAIREVPRSADYEYEYVWVSRILTR